MAAQNNASDNGISVHLTKKEVSSLLKFRKSNISWTKCALAIGIDRTVLKRVLTNQSGSPDTVAKIREVINKSATQI